MIIEGHRQMIRDLDGSFPFVAAIQMISDLDGSFLVENSCLIVAREASEFMAWVQSKC